MLLTTDIKFNLHLSDLKEGDIVRHKSDGEAYIVTGNYGDYVIAVRQIHITNESEWVKINK